MKEIMEVLTGVDVGGDEDQSTSTIGQDQIQPEEVPSSPMRSTSTLQSSSAVPSSSTVQSEYNSKQFLMENFNFSLSSLPERASTPEMYFCRICHQRNLPEPNVSPCHCRGSMGLVHRSCLERWLAASDSTVCEICHYNFTIKRLPKFGIFKALRVWLRTEECKRDRILLVIDIVRIIVALPLILFVNHLTASLFEIFHFEDTEICDLYSFFNDTGDHFNISSTKDILIIFGRFLTYFSLGFTSALDVFAIGWLFSKIEEHYHHWHKWYRTQCTIQVILPDSTEENIEK